jgi:hypothetical protein
MFRLLPNAAGVDEDEISLLSVFRLKVIGTFQEAKDALRVMFVHLTTIGFDIDTLLHWHSFSK